MTLILNGTNGLSDVDGDASTPAVRGTDANTGIFFPAADTIAFSEGGAEVARFDSNGNLGLGTTSPQNFSNYNILTVDDTTGSGAYFRVNGTNTFRVLVNSGGGTLGVQTSAPMTFETNDIERMRIPAAGGVQAVTTVSVGNATPAASGAGITFPDTWPTHASTDANTLDDYEEGTFTPAIEFGGASVGITYSQQQGFYTKIGNLVTCQIRILLSNKGSSSGDATITGLPFTAAGGEAYSGVAGRISSMSFADTYGGFVNVSSTLIVLEEVTNAGSASSIASGDFTNGTNIIFTVSYRV